MLTLIEKPSDRLDSNEIHITQVKSTEEIFRLLNQFDDLFMISISSRVSDMQNYAEKLSKNAFVYTAIDKKDNNIGFVAFYANDTKDKIAYIAYIGVLPAFQAKRVGKKLLDLCINVAKEQGMSSLKLETFKNNDRAIAFYRKNEFCCCGEASDTSMFMSKIL